MANSPVSVVIYGASGNAAGLRDMIVRGLEPGAFAVAAFIDDFRGGLGEELGGAPVISFARWQADLRHLPVIVSVGDPAARRTLADKVRQAGGSFVSAYRIMGAISPDITVGEGTVIGYPAYIGPATRIGDHVLLMTMAVLGHDVTVGDCVTICSSASIAGHVAIEDEVFVGAAAVIVNGTADRPLRIGKGARVAAGAVVTKSVAPGASVTGNPARDVREIASERLAGRRAARPAPRGRLRKALAGAAILLAVLVALTALVAARDRAALRDVKTCFTTGGGALQVCHAAADEGVFYQPGKRQVAYNTQIVALGGDRYATVLHSESQDMERYHALTGSIRPGDSIKAGVIDAAARPGAAYSAPPSLDYRVWGSLTDKASPLYYGYDAKDPSAPGLSGGGNPMTVRGTKGDPFWYMFYLGVASDGGGGRDWRNVLLEARTRDFERFDLLEQDERGRAAWRPFKGEGARPAPVIDAAGRAIASNHPARAEPHGSTTPGRPEGAVITAGVFGSINFLDGRYYYFYTDQDPDDIGRNHLYLRTATDVTTNSRWSEPKVVLDMPPEIMARVAKAAGMDRWAILYNCLRTAAPFVSDICLQYTADLSIDSLAALTLFDHTPYDGYSSHALGLVGAEKTFDAGAFLKGQHYFLSDADGNLAAPPRRAGEAGAADGLVTWMDVPRDFDIFGAPTYWARWNVSKTR